MLYFFAEKYRKIAFLITGLAMLLIFSSCTLLPKEESELTPPIKEPPKVTYDTMEVKKGTIERKISCTGHFVSVLQKDMFFISRGARLKEIYVKEGDQVKKGDLLAEIYTDSLANDIALQKLQLKKAQLRYDKLKAQTDPSSDGKYDLMLAELDVETEGLKLNTLESEARNSKLVASISGEVVYVKDLKQGDNINAYDIVVSVADPKSLQLQYSEEKASSFSLGMKVDVNIDDKNYTGQVIATPKEAPQNTDSATKNSILIKVENLPLSTKMGSRATFSLVLDKRDNVIVLPKRLVNNNLGRKFVNVLVDNIREERDVELGIETDTEVEVVKGLEVGELVIER